MSRPLETIAREIRGDWAKVNFAAEPYLQAMEQLQSVDEDYGYDSGKSVVLYFLSNAGGWRGDTARKVKVELNAMCVPRARWR